jgi:hypothetical protein
VEYVHDFSRVDAVRHTMQDAGCVVLTACCTNPVQPETKPDGSKQVQL